MYEIAKKSYGFKLVFAGSIDQGEMAEWVDESRKALEGSPPAFGVLVDMRTLEPLTPEAKAEMEKGQRLFKEKGMTRSAVGVATATVALQFKRIAKQTGIYEWERYVDASKTSSWEDVAKAWIEREVDPEA